MKIDDGQKQEGISFHLSTSNQYIFEGEFHLLNSAIVKI